MRNGKIVLNTNKIEEAKKWDGLHGVITNLTQEDPNVILFHYRGLWEVEETFRISKHDMKVRPIYHWTPKRIAAHIAICYMALCCIRHLTYRIELQFRRVSAEEIRNELAHQQVSVLTDMVTKKKYGTITNY